MVTHARASDVLPGVKGAGLLRRSRSGKCRVRAKHWDGASADFTPRSGARNWVHSAATVLAFLQKERGLLKPGYMFQPIIRDDVLKDFDAKKLMHSAQKRIIPDPTPGAIIDPADPTDRQSNPTQANTSG